MAPPMNVVGSRRPVAGAGPKIALLTPHTGGNLGDAAIQESALRAIRRRIPNADIVMITLSPATTSTLHGVRCFPIGITTFLPGFEATSEGRVGGEETPEGGIGGSLRRTVRKTPLVRPVARYALRVLHTTRIGAGVREFGHIIRAVAVMRGASMLVVSGGGQIDDYWGGAFRHPYALFKWTMIGRAVGAECEFLSVGVGTLRSKVSRLFVRLALRLAHYRSYRDAESKRRLERWPFVRRDPVCPDLAFGYRAPLAGCRSSADGHRPVVGISPIAYLSKYRWPEENTAVAGTYRTLLVQFIAQLLDHGREVVLFATEPVDRRIIAEILASPCGNEGLLGDHPLVSAPYTETLDQLAPVMRRLDFVVASRLHGVILSHVAWKPVLAISYDRKVRTHMEETGFGDYCLDIHALEVDALPRTFERLEMSAGLVVSRLQSVTAEYRRLVDDQFTRVFGLQPAEVAG